MFQCLVIRFYDPKWKIRTQIFISNQKIGSKLSAFFITAVCLHFGFSRLAREPFYRVYKHRLSFLYPSLLRDGLEFWSKINLVLILRLEKIFWNHLDLNQLSGFLYLITFVKFMFLRYLLQKDFQSYNFWKKQHFSKFLQSYDAKTMPNGFTMS